jgi:hypothetical protein
LKVFALLLGVAVFYLRQPYRGGHELPLFSFGKTPTLSNAAGGDPPSALPVLNFPTKCAYPAGRNGPIAPSGFKVQKFAETDHGRCQCV